ncbi:MAG: aminotransferase class I/II-fold pyridoxal phosphate-dependent enzyme [Myxococcota bacterium]|nr:aminotransferase class I/II-fold pyridoxal phosphate-dependent enzyme [Myxococcota bacterium]
MDFAKQLNDTLRQHHPAAFRCLSRFGRRLYFPNGVPAQAAAARNANFNATIGQLTDDNGLAMPLPSMAKYVNGLTQEEVFLYTAQGGRPDLRAAWQTRIKGGRQTAMSLPVTCAGLTHGLSLVADLFVDEDTSVLLPAPRWENYDLVFQTRRQGQTVNYNVMAGAVKSHRDWGLNLDGLEDAVQQIQTEKSLLVLNYPSNPGGYTPTREEARQVVEVISNAKGPMVILLDEAYRGMEWDQDCTKDSLFHSLSKLDPERFLVVKVDGATKELFFFGGRIGFVSFATPSTAAGAALEEKTKSAIRCAISALPSPSQALVMAALRSSTLEQEAAAIREMIYARYLTLKSALTDSSLDFWNFNSAFFALINAPKGAEATRQLLLRHDLGVVSVPSVQALRISYSTIPCDRIPELVEILSRHVP